LGETNRNRSRRKLRKSEKNNSWARSPRNRGDLVGGKSEKSSSRTISNKNAAELELDTKKEVNVGGGNAQEWVRITSMGMKGKGGEDTASGEKIQGGLGRGLKNGT